MSGLEREAPWKSPSSSPHHGVVVCLTSAIYMVAHANIDCRQSWGNQNLLFYSIQEVAMYMLHSALSKFSNKIQFKRMLQFFLKKPLKNLQWLIVPEVLSKSIFFNSFWTFPTHFKKMSRHLSYCTISPFLKHTVLYYSSVSKAIEKIHKCLCF